MFMEHGLFSMVENKTRQATGISKATMDGWTTAMTLNPNPVVFGESLNKEVSAAVRTLRPTDCRPLIHTSVFEGLSIGMPMTMPFEVEGIRNLMAQGIVAHVMRASVRGRAGVFRRD